MEKMFTIFPINIRSKLTNEKPEGEEGPEEEPQVSKLAVLFQRARLPRQFGILVL